MTLTRDQLRAARMLLHLQQDDLAALSKVPIASIKRFETGTGVHPATLKKIEDALEDAGILIFQGGEWSEEDPAPRDAVASAERPPDSTMESPDAGSTKTGRDGIRRKKRVALGAGVALTRRPSAETLARIEADRLRDEGRVSADSERRKAYRADTDSSGSRPRGRPGRKSNEASETSGEDQG